MIHQQMKKNSVIKWQQYHSVRSYQHKFYDIKSSEHMKIQNVFQVVISHEHNISSMRIVHQSFSWFVISWVFICSDDFVSQNSCQ